MSIANQEMIRNNNRRLVLEFIINYICLFDYLFISS